MTPEIRSITEADKPFIYATMLRGIYHGSEWYNSIEKKSFFTHYAKVVEHLFNKPSVEIKIACLPDDSEIILGYIIMEHSVLHYCHVKEAWRVRGIAKLLLGNSKIETVTHTTKPGNAIRQKNLWTFDPFKI